MNEDSSPPKKRDEIAWRDPLGERRPAEFLLSDKVSSATLSAMPSAAEIQALALNLPLRSRLKLAGDLLRSVGPSVSSDELLDEAALRDDELDRNEEMGLDEATFWDGVRSRRSA